MLYYSRRKGVMLTPRAAVPSIVQGLPRQGYHYLFSTDPQTTPIEIVHEWPWVGVLAPHLYVVGNSRRSVAAAHVVARTAATNGATDTAPPDTEQVALPCDGSRFLVGHAGTTTRISVDSPKQDGIRIWVADDLAPLPWVASITKTGPAQLRCSGTDRLNLSIAPQ
jgi:hypothetical protein